MRREGGPTVGGGGGPAIYKGEGGQRREEGEIEAGEDVHKNVPTNVQWSKKRYPTYLGESGVEVRRPRKV